MFSKKDGVKTSTLIAAVTYGWVFLIILSCFKAKPRLEIEEDIIR